MDKEKKISSLDEVLRKNSKLIESLHLVSCKQVAEIDRLKNLLKESLVYSEYLLSVETDIHSNLETTNKAVKELQGHIKTARQALEDGENERI